MSNSNRYSRKRKHKAIQKKKFLMQHSHRTNESRFIDDYSYYPWPEKSRRNRNGGFTYWDDFSMSGSKGYAKDECNARIRRCYDNLLANLPLDNTDVICDELEDIIALRYAEYQKIFDYWWAIY